MLLDIYTSFAVCFYIVLQLKHMLDSPILFMNFLIKSNKISVIDFWIIKCVKKYKKSNADAKNLYIIILIRVNNNHYGKADY